MEEPDANRAFLKLVYLRGMIMRKFLKILVFILTVLTGVYTITAFVLIRGLGIYRLGTTVGRILATSWQYTGLAALVLVICTAIILLARRKNKEQKVPATAPQSESVTENAQPSAPEAEGKKKTNRKKMKAKGTLAEGQTTQKIPPAAPVAETAELTPEQVSVAETQLLPENSTVEETMPLIAEEQTVQLSENEPTEVLPTEPVVLLSEKVSEQKFCPQCGATAKPDAKFCVKCGTGLGG